MSIDTVAYAIKTRLPWAFSLIELLFRYATVLRHTGSRRLALSRSAVQGAIRGCAATIRPLVLDDAHLLCTFLSEQPDEYMRFFHPHDFSLSGVLSILRSKVHCCYGLFVEERIKAYSLIKLFPTRNAYCGLIVSSDSTGLGLGKFLWRFLIWQCAEMNITPCATVHVSNLASLRSLIAVHPAIRQYPLPNDYQRIVIPVNENDKTPPELDI